MGDFNFKHKKSRDGKHFKYKDSPDRHQEEPDVIGMLKRMQQQLGFLERKIDMLLGQSSSKPYRSEEHHGRRESQSRDDSFGKRSFHKPNKPFPFKRGPRS